jgi:hypothetical protein
LAFDNEEERQAFIDLTNVDGKYEASQSRYAHPDFGELWSTLDQDGIPPGYIRLIDSKNRSFIFPSEDIRLLQPNESLDDSQLIENLNDETKEN